MKKMKEFILSQSSSREFTEKLTNQGNCAEFDGLFTNTNAGKSIGMSRSVIIITLLLLIFPVINLGQAVSGVTGVVTDTTGAVIPGVDVVLINTKTSTELTTKTNESGVYVFSNVSPGEGYRITFSVSSFQTYAISDVSLGVGRTETQNASLTAGDVSATVEVVAAPGDTLNTTDASIGNIIDTRQLRELPIQIRSSPAALIGLQPGVVGNNVGAGTTNRIGSVTGSRADQGNITVDGIDANDQATGQAFSTVGNAPIDAIQEFRAVTTNPNSSEGRSSGGQIQIVTKSGTNQFHGSLREYNRVAEFSANTFFNNRQGRFIETSPEVIQGRAKVGQERAPRAQLTRNQFGGNLGGPLPFLNFGEGGPTFNSGKDRLFFFFDYEGRRDAQGFNNTPRIVPLNHFRNGGLAYINNTPGCPTTARLNTRPDCITILTPAQVAALDPQRIGPNQALLSTINSRYPEANDLTLGDGINTGGYRFTSPTSRADNTYTTRIDGFINDRQKVFGRLNIARRINTDVTNTVAQQFPGDPESGQIQVRDYSIAFGHSWVISDSLFNQVTIGNSHSGLVFASPFRPAFPNSFTFGGGLSAPFASISEQSRVVNTPTIRDDATYTRGSHTFQFGVQFKPIRSATGLSNDFNFAAIGLGGNTGTLNATLRPSNIRIGNANVNAAYDRAFALLLGRIATVQTNFNYNTSGQALAPGSGKVRNFRYNEYEYYAQDNWKIRSDLTINLGLRYQYYPAPYEKDGFQTGPDTDFDELFAKRVANGAAGIAGDTAEPLLTYTLIGKGNNARPYYKTDKNNFAPRVGFAYNPSFDGGFMGAVFGDRKTVIRGGASKVYERISGGVTFIADQNSYLFDNTATRAFGGGSATTALLNDPRFTGLLTVPQNIAPTITNPITPFTVNGAPVGNATGEFNYAISQKFEVPYSYQYSFGIQRELPGNFLVDISYVGRTGRKLFTQADAAQIVDFKDPASGQTLLGALNALQSGSTATQPFFENQGALALGVPCAQSVGSTCTQYVIDAYGGLVDIGDASDTVQALFADGLLRANVGLSGQFSTNAYITNLGSSQYDALLLSVQKRFSQGFQFDFNYTFSHSTDNQSTVANTVSTGFICDVRNPDICQGPSDFDIRHLINVNGIWELPIGRGRYFGGNMNGFLNAVFGGFAFSGIYTYRSGLPFQINTGSFPIGFNINESAILVGDASLASSNIQNVGSGPGSSINLFGENASVLTGQFSPFRNPRNGENGPRNNLRGPSFWNLDLGLQKNFSLPWEGQRLQLRVDAFNLFNRNVFSLPTAANLNINGSTFGQITTSATSPRELQFAIRYDF